MIKEKRMLVRKGFHRCCAALLLIGALAFSRAASAQTFDADKSGKAGIDGVLDLTGSTSPVEFDPVARGIDLDGDNIFHFTSVKIPNGVQLKVTAKKVNGPMYWLVTGPVVIDGHLALDGETGHPYSTSATDRRPTIPGPGGHPGGVGGIMENPTTFRLRPQPGGGPGAGGIGLWNDSRGRSGAYPGNKFLVPLVGGSGGGGGVIGPSDACAAGGGAGGGAILIASSTSIHVGTGGNISAWGGYGGRRGDGLCNGADGGPGSGGSIRLVAPRLSGDGHVEAGAGHHCSFGHEAFAKGSVRLEAFRNDQSYRIRSEYTNYSIGSPVSSYVPTGAPPAIWVASIDGRPLPRNPNGSFNVPDLGDNPPFSSTVAVPVVIKAANVPLKTTTKVSLYLVSMEQPVDQVISELSMPPLTATGTLGESTLTVNVKFPPGYSRGYVRVKW